jgi:5-formyltetrahydrofolate cyclo-ligase
MTINRNELRRAMRARRRLVTRADRLAAARRFAAAADRLHLLRPGRRIAIYLPHGSEADVMPIARRAWQRGCEVYAPVITHRRRYLMRFAPYAQNPSLILNAHGIAEPDHMPRERIDALALDVIFMPLVAFDARGWRLGSGAGFYDRSLRHLSRIRAWRRPTLIGVAYEHQLTDALTPHAWDVPMDAVLTESRIHLFDTQTNKQALGSAR